MRPYAPLLLLLLAGCTPSARPAAQAPAHDADAALTLAVASLQPVSTPAPAPAAETCDCAQTGVCTCEAGHCDCPNCDRNLYAVAYGRAAAQAKPLFVWVHCDRPELERRFPEAVHVHLQQPPEGYDARRPCLIVGRWDGLKFHATVLPQGKRTVANVRAALGVPQVRLYQPPAPVFQPTFQAGPFSGSFGGSACRT